MAAFFRLDLLSLRDPLTPSPFPVLVPTVALSQASSVRTMSIPYSNDIASGSENLACVRTFRPGSMW